MGTVKQRYGHSEVFATKALLLRLFLTHHSMTQFDFKRHQSIVNSYVLLFPSFSCLSLLFFRESALALFRKPLKERSAGRAVRRAAAAAAEQQQQQQQPSRRPPNRTNPHRRRPITAPSYCWQTPAHSRHTHTHTNNHANASDQRSGLQSSLFPSPRCPLP